MFKRFLRYYGPHRGLLILDMSSAIVSAGVSVFFPFLTRILLGVAIPQLNARDVRVELKYAAEFGEEVLTATLVAGWERYRQLKQATDELAKTATAFNATLTVALRFPDGLAVDSDGFRAIHEVLTTMGLGVIRLEAATATARASAAEATA